jgi:hypothetical protein
MRPPTHALATAWTVHAIATHDAPLCGQLAGLDRTHMQCQLVAQRGLAHCRETRAHARGVRLTTEDRLFELHMAPVAPARRVLAKVNSELRRADRACRAAKVACGNGALLLQAVEYNYACDVHTVLAGARVPVDAHRLRDSHARLWRLWTAYAAAERALEALE